MKAFVEKRLFNYSYRLPWRTRLQVANSLSLWWFRVRRAKWLFNNWIIRQGNTMMYRLLNTCWVKIKPFKDWHLIRIVNERYAIYFKNPATEQVRYIKLFSTIPNQVKWKWLAEDVLPPAHEWVHCVNPVSLQAWAFLLEVGWVGCVTKPLWPIGAGSAGCCACCPRWYCVFG